MIAEPSIINPTSHRPAFSVPVASVSAPVMYGATKPARLPSELIYAIPAAAAVPVRKTLGSGQKTGSAPKMPIAQSVTATITANGDCR